MIWFCSGRLPNGVSDADFFLFVLFDREGVEHGIDSIQLKTLKHKIHYQSEAKVAESSWRQPTKTATAATTASTAAAKAAAASGATGKTAGETVRQFCSCAAFAVPLGRRETQPQRRRSLH